MSGRLHRGVALTGSVAGAAVVALDGTVLTVVQPVLQRDLGAGFAQVQWASTGYLIAVASLLVLAGRLGDRHGHEKLFAVGILGRPTGTSRASSVASAASKRARPSCEVRARTPD
ncbi:MFS transporter, partial [Streptomyces zhihengii]